MANYEAVCRSTWFRVKDAEAFKRDMEQLCPEMMVWEKEGKAAFGEFCGLPYCRYVCQDGVEIKEEVVDISELVQSHLADGETAVVCEIGYEKLRYVSGFQYHITGEKIEYTQIGAP